MMGSLRKYIEIRMHVVGCDRLEALKQHFRGFADDAKTAGRRKVYDVTMKVRKRRAAGQPPREGRNR